MGQCAELGGVVGPQRGDGVLGLGGSGELVFEPMSHGWINEPDSTQNNLPACGEVGSDRIENMRSIGLKQLGMDGDQVTV